MNTLEILSLSWQIQLALASGYAAYAIASTGRRAHHSAVDVVFITLVFSVLATAALSLADQHGITEILSGAFSFIVTILAGIVWRKWLSKAYKWALRASNLTWSDDAPSVYESLAENADWPLTQISILTDDGTWLKCQDTSIFLDAPFGPCIIGKNGEVAIYITHKTLSSGEEVIINNVRDPHYGDRISYVPSSRIKQINFRYRK